MENKEVKTIEHDYKFDDVVVDVVSHDDTKEKSRLDAYKTALQENA